MKFNFLVKIFPLNYLNSAIFKQSYYFNLSSSKECWSCVAAGHDRYQIKLKVHVLLHNSLYLSPGAFAAFKPVSLTVIVLTSLIIRLNFFGSFLAAFSLQNKHNCWKLKKYFFLRGDFNIFGFSLLCLIASISNNVVVQHDCRLHRHLHFLIWVNHVQVSLHLQPKAIYAYKTFVILMKIVEKYSTTNIMSFRR